jgi:hypothetical protein
MKVELSSIFTKIESQRPQSIVVIYKSLQSWDDWEDRAKVVRRKHEPGADRFTSGLEKYGIRFLPISSEDVENMAGEIAQCDMCIVTGEPFYSLISIGKSVIETGYKRSVFLEITPEEAARKKCAKIALERAERYSATELLANFVYLTKRRGETRFLEFSVENLKSDFSKQAPAKKFVEGRVREVRLSKPERSPGARSKCVEIHGAKCAICKFDFSIAYGTQGEGLIHVHHLKAVAEADGERAVDPLKDLLPVCPNCHLFIHSRKPMFTPQEVAELLDAAKILQSVG